MRTIAVINQKGGVGKTTSTLNLAHALALAGRRVLALDMDPQGQLSDALGRGLDPAHGRGLDRVLLEGARLAEQAIEVRPRLALVPAGERLAELEYLTEGGAERGWRLAQAIAALGNGEAPFDYLLIDAPPSTGLIAMNVLMAVDEVLVPVASDYLGLHGVSRFAPVLAYIDETLGRRTALWIAVTRFNERRRLAREVRAKLVEHFPGAVLATAVRESAALAECPGFGQSIFEYEPRGRGAEDYRALAEDLELRRTI
jgi:chromosome partitioning protein